MNKTLLTLLILALFLINPYAQTVDAVSRYTRITGENPFYIITGESTNTSNTHFNYYRTQLDPTTYEIIDKTKILSTDTAYTNSQPSTPHYYKNRLLFGNGLYDINTLTETPESIASWTHTFNSDLHDGGFLTFGDLKHAMYYNPISKIYITHSTRTGYSVTSYYYDHHINEIYSLGASHISYPQIRPFPFINGILHRTSTSSSAGQLFSPSGVLASTTPYTPSVQSRGYSIEQLHTSTSPIYYYVGSTDTAILQKVMNNESTSVRTINTALTRIYSHTPVSSRSNYLYIVGYFTVVDPEGDYNVASIEVRDRSGNLVTGSNSGIPDTQYTNIIELETGDIGLIRHNTNISRYYLEIRDPLTLNLKKSIAYEETKLYTITSKLTDRYGIDPTQFNMLNSGVYSKENGGFDAVPKDAYIFSNNGSLPLGTTINNIDHTNRIYEITLELDANIDYYPLNYLVDDNDFKTDSNEKYGYFILTDMSLLQTINTGTITSTDTYELTTYLSNSRFYIIDANITLTNTSEIDTSTSTLELNQEPLFLLFNRHITPANSLLDSYIGISYNPILTNDLALETPHLMAYPQIVNSAHDYTNIKILIDKYNNRYSTNSITYFNDGSSFDSGHTTWASLLTGTESIQNITLGVGTSTGVDADINVYRSNNLPILNTRNTDTTITTTKNMMVPILRSGTNKVNIIYSDYSTTQHANFEEWTIIINTIGGDILGIGPSGETTETTPDQVPQGTLILGGLLPDFMPTTQQSVMFYALAITLFSMVIIFLMGAGTGYAPIGFISAIAFGFMFLTYFSIVGWLPAWIPVLGFVIAGLIGASMIRNAFVGGN